jgi:hypothetical protein
MMIFRSRNDADAACKKLVARGWAQPNPVSSPNGTWMVMYRSGKRLVYLTDAEYDMATTQARPNRRSWTA